MRSPHRHRHRHRHRRSKSRDLDGIPGKLKEISIRSSGGSGYGRSRRSDIVVPRGLHNRHNRSSARTEREGSRKRSRGLGKEREDWSGEKLTREQRENIRYSFVQRKNDNRKNQSSATTEREGSRKRSRGLEKEREERSEEKLTREQRERIRFSSVQRKKDFKCMERVNGRFVNVLEGLELHCGVFSAAAQKRIVDFVYDLQEKGRNRQLKARTYSEPRKWMRGKGRITLQFGCCYNYARDKYGNPPGILRDEVVDPLPPLMKSMIKRMVEWHVLPPTCIPNSCIINIYDRDDCIPPHIDHHDFVRPFCTVSFLSECKILFGSELKIEGPGEFRGSTAIPLPLGSVLVLKGNGADVAKHCVPAVPAKRISITFRKMDDSKLPFKFAPDPELQNLRPLSCSAFGSPVQRQARHQTPQSQVQQVSSHSRSWRSSRGTPPLQVQQVNSYPRSGSRRSGVHESNGSFHLGEDEFPALGSSSSSVRTRRPSRSIRR